MPPRTRLSCGTDLGRARCHALIHDKYTKTCTVDPVTDCWLFTGSVNTDGYGQIWTKKNADLHKTGRSVQTAFLIHSISFTAANGRDATNQILHLCDRRQCFNPDHLRDETAVVNNSRKNCAGPSTARTTAI